MKTLLKINFKRKRARQSSNSQGASNLALKVKVKVNTCGGKKEWDNINNPITSSFQEKDGVSQSNSCPCQAMNASGMRRTGQQAASFQKGMEAGRDPPWGPKEKGGDEWHGKRDKPGKRCSLIPSGLSKNSNGIICPPGRQMVSGCLQDKYNSNQAKRKTPNTSSLWNLLFWNNLRVTEEMQR